MSMSEHFIDLFGLQVPVTYYIKIGERVYGDEPHVDPLFRGKRIAITDMLHYLPEYSQEDREIGIYEHEDKATLWAVRAYGIPRRRERYYGQGWEEGDNRCGVPWRQELARV